MLSQLLPKLCASEPRPPEVLKASYSVPSISISSSALERPHFDQPAVDDRLARDCRIR